MTFPGKKKIKGKSLVGNKLSRLGTGRKPCTSGGRGRKQSHGGRRGLQWEVGILF